MPLPQKSLGILLALKLSHTYLLELGGGGLAFDSFEFGGAESVILLQVKNLFQLGLGISEGLTLGTVSPSVKSERCPGTPPGAGAA